MGMPVEASPQHAREDEDMGRKIVYTRVSTLAQEDGASLDVQEEEGRDYCGRKSHSVVEVISDTYSGHATMGERPGLQRAIKLIRSGDADGVVVWRYDRGNRDILDNLLLLREVSEAGGTLESVTEGPITNNATGKMVLAAMSYAAETEWEAIRQRTRMGLDRRAKNGGQMVPPVPIYGYRFFGEKKETYIIDEDAAEVVCLIFDKADRGWSVRRIRDWLNANGKKTASQLLASRGELPGKRRIAEEWSSAAVLDILNREAYTGRLVINGWETYKVKVQTDDGRMKTVTRKRRRAESDPRVNVVSIPAIVEKETWERVNATLHARYLNTWEGTPGDDDQPLLNRGIAVCGLCGAGMTTAKHPTMKRVYRCQRRPGSESKTSHACRAYAVSVKAADADIWSRVKAIAKDRPRFQRLVRSRWQFTEDTKAMIVHAQEMLVKETADAEKMKATWTRRIAAETDDGVAAVYREELKKTLDLLADCAKKAAALEEATGMFNTAMESFRFVKYMMDILVPGWDVTTIDEKLDSLTREEKRGIMKTLGVEVRMFPKSHEFTKRTGQRWEFKFTGGEDVPAESNGSCLPSGEKLAP
jgi:site-specific DNA recombinase